MKTNFKQLLTLAIILGIGFIASCSDDGDGDSSDPANKTALAASIAEAENLLETTTEGTQVGQYLEGSKAPLQTAVTAANVVVDNDRATQTQVDNTNVNLQAAITTYESKLIEPIAATDLVAYYNFDEGTGTVAGDASGNERNGTLMVGSQYAGNGPVPTWTTDRNGVAGKALHFTKGGHVEVPANAAFNPTEITVSLWVKLDSLNTTDCNALGGRCNGGVYADNYMISQNYWDGYKFQTQEAKKIFATVHAEPSIYDRDTDNSELKVKLKRWTHVAFTYKDGELNLYVDGQLAWGWTNTPGAIKTIDNLNDFLIGAELPNSKITSDPGYIINHFEGSMDEVRIYRKALTGAQITLIFNQ